MQWQLSRSQWWSQEALLEQQFRQIRELAGQAVANVPFYRHALADVGLSCVEDLDRESFRRWPVLRKRDVRTNESALRAVHYPSTHGRVSYTSTTGSTGEPVRIAYTDMAQAFSQALFLRDHLLHERDLSQKLAVINSGVTRGTAPAWGIAGEIYHTGPVATLSSSTDLDGQLDWLIEERPAYLITQANNLRSLLLRSKEARKAPTGIRQAITISDMPSPDLRDLATTLWSTSLAATYVAEECGPIASQCPGCNHYLVHAENVYVEVLREDGSPCAVGEPGRLVITPLHNFAMPLIRYEIGDYAESGNDCPTGRGLPVLLRISGRARNMAQDPTGRRFWPSFPASLWLAIAPVQKIQLIQRSLSSIEVRYVMARALSAAESNQLQSALHEALGYPFQITYQREPNIDGGAGGKYEDFVSMIIAS